MRSVLLLVTMCAYTVRCHPPPHPDVLAVRQEEELLPPVLKKPALRNPHLRELISLTSLLHHGEKLVFDREAHDVSRKEIYNILTHAGLIPRNRHQQPIHNRAPSSHKSLPLVDNFVEPIYFSSQDILQHL